MSDADNRQRAEFPPAGFWRRWCEDAPAPTLPAAEPIVDPATMAAATAALGATAPAAVQSPPSAIAPSPPGQAPAAPWRVLIVEDDPSQALFAESVLFGAGMQAQVVSVTSEVMDAMEQLRPDLVLMDLHMPGLDGVELTEMIRAHPEFAPTPVVFLTGDEDPEVRFDALEIGADDFLRKPVRPRHLISAVQNRIQRARTQQAPAAEVQRHPTTGLHTRPQMLQLLSATVPGADTGGVFFVEIAGSGALRDRFGYAALETLLSEAGRRLGQVASPHAASRLNDNTFLVLAAAPGDGLLALARQLRDGLGDHVFAVGEEQVRLRAVVGYADLALGFEEAGAALSAAEEGLRGARVSPHGVAAWTRPVSAQDQASAELERALRDALASEGLAAVFQPIVAVAGGADAQYQVLVRLRDAKGSVHAAGAVLAAAARAGLTAEVDRRIVEIAIATLQRQQAQHRSLRLFVTQAPTTLAHDGHARWLLERLAAAGVGGASLIIDVRQEDALVHALSLQEFCGQMVSAGIQLCLSQYRYGTESNALLSQLPLGYVRLASRYSSQLDDTLLRDEMRSAIEYAHRLGLQVIGQQVEDAQSAATLWMTGIDFIQGNLVQRPGGEIEFDFHNSVL